MGMSQEFPELQFVPPRAYGTGRDGRKVKLSVVHYTAGSERSTSAEDGAAYDQRRTDGTSCHFFHDQNSSVQCVYRWNRANSAFHKGNRLGVQHELCGTLQTRGQWLDPASDATLWRAARYVANDCLTYGLQPRRLSVAETRATWYSNAPGGIVGHVDITRAFPEDGGTHTDPGPEFPWDIFLDRVHHFMNGDDMPLEGEDLRKVNQIDSTTYFGVLGLQPTVSVPLPAQGGGVTWTSKPNELAATLQRIEEKAGAVAELSPEQLAQVEANVGQRLENVLAAKLGTVLIQALQTPEVQAAVVQAVNTAEDS